MYRYNTDKSRDDHKYSDLYSMLFDPVRHEVQNVTELGVMSGQSMKVWHEYFPNASVFGLDVFLYFDLARVQAALAPFKRVRLFRADSRRESDVLPLGLAPGSMDLVIDDASHSLACQEKTLQVMWRFVRVGGYYVIEDIEWDRDGDRRTYPMIHMPEQLRKSTAEILQNNDAFFADTTVGHRAFELWGRRIKAWSPNYAPKGLQFVDRASHSSHVLVIRRRADPLPPIDVQLNVKAMVM